MVQRNPGWWHQAAGELQKPGQVSGSSAGWELNVRAPWCSCYGFLCWGWAQCGWQHSASVAQILATDTFQTVSSPLSAHWPELSGTGGCTDPGRDNPCLHGIFVQKLFFPLSFNNIKCKRSPALPAMIRRSIKTCPKAMRRR